MKNNGLQYGASLIAILATAALVIIYLYQNLEPVL